MGVWCKIIVNHPIDGIHKAGNRVTGVVKYAVDKPTEYKDIVLSFTGQGTVSWREGRTEIDGNITYDNYNGSEEYVSQRIHLLKKKSSETITLPVGCFEHSFVFTLPNNVPSSGRWYQNGVSCNIWYEITANFKKPNYFSFDKKIKKELIVRGTVKLLKPDVPVTRKLEKCLFSPFSNNENRVNLECEIEKSVYMPGESITVKCLLINDSEKRVKSLRSEIVAETTYSADNGRENTCGEVITPCTCESPVIFENSIAKINLKSPTLPKLSSIQQSTIVSRRYFVRVTVILPFPHINTRIEIPIVIGDTGYDEIASEAEENPPPSYSDAMKKDDMGKED